MLISISNLCELNIFHTFRVFGSGKQNLLSLNDFLVGVGQLKFRGTSVLLRSPLGSAVENIKRVRIKESKGIQFVTSFRFSELSQYNILIAIK